MAQVKFLQGLRENLPRELSPGAIYFTQDERKLYIDTELSRLPVVGDCGKVFYLDLSFGNWTADKNDNNNLTKPSIFVTEYKNSITDNTSYSLETLYNEEIILFTGNAFKLSNDNNKIVLNNIICKGFKTIEGKLGLQFQYVGQDFSSILSNGISVYIQMYTPNPNPTAYISPNINKTVYTNNYKLRGAEFWTAGENQKEWKQSIQIYGVDLETQPYIVSRNDDSLENIQEYMEIKKIEAKYEQETNISTLEFTTIGDNPPGWVISIDLFIMMPKKGAGEWSKVIIPANTTPNMNNQIEITVDEANEIYSLNNVTGDRELIVFCAKPNDLYKNITNVTFGKNNNTGSYIFNFNSTEFNDITEDTILYVCQMNNISNQILTHTVNAGNWKEYSTTLKNAVTENNEKYYVYTYSPSIALLGKHQPLIYSIGENKEIFDQIVEIKIYNGSLMLYAKNKINNNFDIKIIDFK